MSPCALCDRERLVEDLPLCDWCEEEYLHSPESARQYAAWEYTGSDVRPHLDSWWSLAQTAAMDYVRRVQAERRNGGAA